MSSGNNNNNPRIPHRRLNRPEIYNQLSRFQRKWNKLNYARFVIQSESELNPDRTNDPDDNFSVNESVRGYLTRIPIRNRPYDARQYIDNLGRPDQYARRWANAERRRWNEDPANYPVQIYRVSYLVKETHAATRRTAEYTVDVWHDYLQTLRGAYSVRQVDTNLSNGVDGLEQARARIQSAENVRTVDAAIEDVLRENERIQNGTV